MKIAAAVWVLVLVMLAGYWYFVGDDMQIPEPAPEVPRHREIEQMHTEKEQAERAASRLQVPTTEEPKVYSPADFPIPELKLGDIIQVKGVLRNKQVTHANDIIFTLDDKGSAMLGIAHSDKPIYRDGDTVTLKGHYMTTKALEVLISTKINDRNVAVVWIME